MIHLAPYQTKFYRESRSGSDDEESGGQMSQVGDQVVESLDVVGSGSRSDE